MPADSHDEKRFRAWHEQNRKSWNAATRAHNSHKRDQAGFLRAGGTTLFPEECALLGDVRGKRLVHLQCNAGQDSLSLAAMGAAVTGVDISDEAIAFAEKLSAESGIPARFVRADLYDWLDEAARGGERFDIAFASYGALPWLSDLGAWAKGAARILVPGGRLVVIEFHPVRGMFETDLTLRWPYFRETGPLYEPEGLGDYVADSGNALAPMGYEEGARDFRNPEPSYEFPFSIADVLTATLEAGLRLERFEEYPYSNGCQFFAAGVEDAQRRMWPPPGTPKIPQMFGLVARG